MGLGEMSVVLNGVEFRTRHNDYPMRMPSRWSRNYHSVDDIPYPPVPPEVTRLKDVNDQIREMREFFRAWKEQNVTHRDYRPYFKAALCYMEGAWTTDVKTFREPFFSTRHALVADSWFELQEKTRFSSYTGRKHKDENLAYLPTTIINITDGVPKFAQWNYRILCHPIEKDIPLKHLKMADDLAARFARGKTIMSQMDWRGARFYLEAYEKDRIRMLNTLDYIFAEIPGKDNYVANIQDDSFGTTLYDARFKQYEKVLNTGLYHRWYRMGQKGPTVRRGFNDRNLFVAETTRTEVAPMSVTDCFQSLGKRVCKKHTKRVSYAIPLEIVYMTPLLLWNPYKIVDYGYEKTPQAQGVRRGGRNGGMQPWQAFNGTNSNTFYRTPVQFFTGGLVGAQSQDTVRDAVGVLDPQGIVRRVASSGNRIVLPALPGLGNLRTRFPIAPVYGEGKTEWKDLDALRTTLLHLNKFGHFLDEQPPVPLPVSDVINRRNRANKKGNTVRLSSGAGSQPSCMHGPAGSSESVLNLVMEITFADPPGMHDHFVDLTFQQAEYLQRFPNSTLLITTSFDNRHSHDLEITFNASTSAFQIVQCDRMDVCWDGHGDRLFLQEGILPPILERMCPGG
nr:hypothetical protein BaRGS_002768 [Batillaria attramentaria]